MSAQCSSRRTDCSRRKNDLHLFFLFLVSSLLVHVNIPAPNFKSYLVYLLLFNHQDVIRRAGLAIYPSDFVLNHVSLHTTGRYILQTKWYTSYIYGNKKAQALHQATTNTSPLSPTKHSLAFSTILSLSNFTSSSSDSFLSCPEKSCVGTQAFEMKRRNSSARSASQYMRRWSPT